MMTSCDRRCGLREPFFPLRLHMAALIASGTGHHAHWGAPTAHRLHRTEWFLKNRGPQSACELREPKLLHSPPQLFVKPHRKECMVWTGQLAEEQMELWMESMAFHLRSGLKVDGSQFEELLLLLLTPHIHRPWCDLLVRG